MRKATLLRLTTHSLTTGTSNRYVHASPATPLRLTADEMFSESAIVTCGLCGATYKVGKLLQAIANDATHKARRIAGVTAIVVSLMIAVIGGAWIVSLLHGISIEAIIVLSGLTAFSGLVIIPLVRLAAAKYQPVQYHMINVSGVTNPGCNHTYSISR